MRLEEIIKLKKKSITSSGIEAETFPLAAQCLNQLRPESTMLENTCRGTNSLQDKYISEWCYLSR
jgi:hypothetical protein